MCTFIWLMVGLILLAITIFIHKHTYWWEAYDKRIGSRVPFPLFLLAIMIFVALVPILNLIAFLAGAVIWLINASGSRNCYYNSPNIVFHYEARWYKSFLGFLTKEV